MNRLISVVATAAILVVGSFASARQEPWGFSVKTADGKSTGSSDFMGVPYKPGLMPNLYIGSGPNQATLRDASGVVITGFAFYGWKEGDTIRVAVLALLLPDGLAIGNYRLPDKPTPETLPLKEIATYTLSVDKPASIVEMQALGLTPMTLTVGVGVPPWPRPTVK